MSGIPDIQSGECDRRPTPRIPGLGFRSFGLMLPISEISLHQVNGLAAQVDSFEHSFAEAIRQGDGERAAGLTLAARLEGKAPLDGPQLLWLLERFDDPVLAPCLVGACADSIEPLALVEGFRRCMAGDFRELLVDSQQCQPAAGVAPAWSKCKRLRQTDNVFSTRLGREYRMLFRVEEKESQLRIEQMVHRSELERTIKGLKF